MHRETTFNINDTKHRYIRTEYHTIVYPSGTYIMHIIATINEAPRQQCLSLHLLHLGTRPPFRPHRVLIFRRTCWYTCIATNRQRTHYRPAGRRVKSSVQSAPGRACHKKIVRAAIILIVWLADWRPSFITLLSSFITHHCTKTITGTTTTTNTPNGPRKHNQWLMVDGWMNKWLWREEKGARRFRVPRRSNSTRDQEEHKSENTKHATKKKGKYIFVRPFLMGDFFF